MTRLPTERLTPSHADLRVRPPCYAGPVQVRYVAVATRGTTYHVVDPLLDVVVPPGKRIPTLCGRWTPHPTSTLKTVPADANLCARCAKSLERLRRSETDAEDLAR